MLILVQPFSCDLDGTAWWIWLIFFSNDHNQVSVSGTETNVQFLYPYRSRKNCPQMLLIIGPHFFFSTGPAAQTAQKQKSRTTKSPLMQDWVFRLGKY